VGCVVLGDLSASLFDGFQEVIFKPLDSRADLSIQRFVKLFALFFAPAFLLANV